MIRAIAQRKTISQGEPTYILYPFKQATKVRYVAMFGSSLSQKFGQGVQSQWAKKFSWFFSEDFKKIFDPKKKSACEHFSEKRPATTHTTDKTGQDLSSEFCLLYWWEKSAKTWSLSLKKFGIQNMVEHSKREEDTWNCLNFPFLFEWSLQSNITKLWFKKIHPFSFLSFPTLL